MAENSRFVITWHTCESMAVQSFATLMEKVDTELRYHSNDEKMIQLE